MRKILFLLLLCVYIYPAYTQTPGLPEVLSLEKCIDIALQNNYEIRIANAQATTSTAEITSAFGDFLPSIGYNLGYSRQLNAEGGRTVNIGGQIIPVPATDPNSYNMSAYASYSIFNGFSREANYNRAQDNYNAQYLSAQYTQQKVKKDVYQQYINVINNYQIVKIRKDNLELGKKELERIKAQNETGVIAVGVVYSQEADLGNKEYELVLAEKDLNVAKAMLLATMGLEPDRMMDFQESSLPNNILEDDISRFRTEIGNFASAVNRALEKRLDYSSIKSNISASESNLTIARSGYFPTISAQGGWTWANNTFDKFSELGRSYIGLNLSIPIFENFNTNARIQSARLQLTQSQIQLAQAEQNIRSSIQTAFLNLESAEKLLDITQRALRAASQNNESAKERFRVGSASITDYLTANNQLINAQINRINAVYNYFLSQKEVLFAIGDL